MCPFQNELLFCSFQEVYRYISMHAQLSRLILWAHGLYSTRLPCPWNSPDKILQWVAISYSIYQCQFSSVQFCHSVMCNSLRPHGLQHTRPPCPLPTQSLLKLISIELVMPSNHLILCRPLLLLPSIFPHQGLFKWVSSLHQVAKVLEFQLQHQSFLWTFRTDFLYSPGNALGQDTGVGSLSLLQGIFPTQESNWGLLHCRQILYQLSYQESPYINIHTYK